MNFVKSPYADSIYYADLFEINDKKWMIMGCGKSEAARLANDRDSTKDFSRDSAAIALEGNTLKARFDMGAINLDLEESKRDSLYKFHKIDCIAYCLFENETRQIFKNKSLSIIECDLDYMAKKSTVFPYTGTMSRFVFSDEEMQIFENDIRRQHRFFEIVHQADNVKLVLVPFMRTMEEKAKLYREYTV